jgi:hypothetical protein
MGFRRWDHCKRLLKASWNGSEGTFCTLGADNCQSFERLWDCWRCSSLVSSNPVRFERLSTDTLLPKSWRGSNYRHRKLYQGINVWMRRIEGQVQVECRGVSGWKGCLVDVRAYGRQGRPGAPCAEQISYPAILDWSTPRNIISIVVFRIRGLVASMSFLITSLFLWRVTEVRCSYNGSQPRVPQSNFLALGNGRANSRNSKSLVY